MKHRSSGASTGSKQVRARYARCARNAVKVHGAASEGINIAAPSQQHAASHSAPTSAEAGGDAHDRPAPKLAPQPAPTAAALVCQAGGTKSAVRSGMLSFSILGGGICALVAMGMMWGNPELGERNGDSYFDSASALTGSVDKQILAGAALPGIGQMLANGNSSGNDATLGYGLGFDAGLLPAASNAWRVPRTEAAALPHDQKAVTAWLARKYRVAGDAANMVVSATYSTAKDLKFDPLLILAVMAIESGMNPIAESPMGAQGLMQVMSKVHHEKFRPLGGVEAALNPVANIKVGSMILKDYVKRGGSVEAGLKMYVGAAAFDSDAGYGNKVLSEYRRLQEVARGKTVAMNAVVRRPTTIADNGNNSAPATATAAAPAPAPGAASAAPAPGVTTSKPNLVDGGSEPQKTVEPSQRKVEVLAAA